MPPTGSQWRGTKEGGSLGSAAHEAVSGNLWSYPRLREKEEGETSARAASSSGQSSRFVGAREIDSAATTLNRGLNGVRQVYRLETYGDEEAAMWARVISGGTATVERRRGQVVPRPST